MTIMEQTAAITILFLCTNVYISRAIGYINHNNGVDKGGEFCQCMQGPSGPPGVPGVPGMHGHRGSDGRKGDKGGHGDPGPEGKPGFVGPIGPPGSMGNRGRKGDSGNPGFTGTKGERGPVGFMGTPGLPGQKGEPGDLQKPNRKIAFSVGRSVKLGPVIEDTPITYDNIYTNTGNCFDEYSSHFVSKVNGTFLFMAHVLGQYNKDVYAWIMLNKKHKVPLHGNARAGYGMGSQTIILHLNVDDHVWIQISKDSGLLNDYSTFSGFLLFED